MPTTGSDHLATRMDQQSLLQSMRTPPVATAGFVNIAGGK